MGGPFARFAQHPSVYEAHLPLAPERIQQHRQTGHRFRRIAPAARIHQNPLPRKIGVLAGAGRQRRLQLDHRRVGLMLQPQIRHQPRGPRQKQRLDLGRAQPGELRLIAFEQAPRSATTGTPAPLSASMSRRMVRSETSRRLARSRAVTRRCTCSRRWMESRRSARIEKLTRKDCSCGGIQPRRGKGHCTGARRCRRYGVCRGAHLAPWTQARRWRAGHRGRYRRGSLRARRPGHPGARRSGQRRGGGHLIPPCGGRARAARSHGRFRLGRDHSGKPFWELSAGIWRATPATLGAAWLPGVHAARIMVKQRGGLLIRVTDSIHSDVSAYRGQILWDLGHEFLNRLIADMSRELQKSKVAMVGLNPGFMRTERVLRHMTTEALKKQFRFDLSESVEYIGRAAAALAADPKALRKTGQLLWAAELAKEYGFTDVDGRVIPLFDPNAPPQPYPC